MTLAEQLRDETRPQHEHTEHLLYTDALRAGALSAQQYGHLLLMHGAFHQALEAAIEQHPVFFRGYEPDTRRKIPWLQADLTQLRLTIPRLPELFDGWVPAELLGAAYVGEGSMLGGKTVWHYLQQSPALPMLLQQASFYRGYGAETGARWRAFTTFLNQQPVDPSMVIAGAKQAFGLYDRLFWQTLPTVSSEGYSAG